MEQINALGRRKSSVARVYLTEGTGKITINKKDLTQYFPSVSSSTWLSSHCSSLRWQRSMTLRLTLTVAASQVRARLSALLSHAHSLRLTLTTRRHSAQQASSHVTHVLLSVRSRVSQRHAVASSSLSVKLGLPTLLYIIVKASQKRTAV